MKRELAYCNKKTNSLQNVHRSN